MSAPPLLERSREHELRELYARYKGLALATGAALLLEADPGRLLGESAALLEDCGRAASEPRADHAPQLEACVSAARELHELLLRAGEDGDLIGPEDTERVRASHSRLRREVWKVFPCEYVPCSGAHRHRHAHER